MPGVELVRQVGDMVAEMRGARASLSQCGYNTALDILVARVPALVVPYATETENEQSERATKLAALGAMMALDAPGGRAAAGAHPDPVQLAAAIEALLRFAPAANALALDGAAESARVMRRLHQDNESCATA